VEGVFEVDFLADDVEFCLFHEAVENLEGLCFVEELFEVDVGGGEFIADFGFWEH
jgi:hypothetical protein